MSGVLDLAPAVRSILAVQSRDGAIPWFAEGPWDAWNHSECLMALDAAGETDAVVRGFEHLATVQEPGGGWLCGYGSALPMDGPDRISRGPAPAVRDTNFAAYPATALWAHWRRHRRIETVRRFWPMARAGIAFVLALQHPQGDISWCAEAHGTELDDALTAGCASIWASLGHAQALAKVVGDPQPHWGLARERLGQALRERPERFDRAGIDRSGFAMDWYYPVLAGVLRPELGASRIARRRSQFVEAGRGCRCVAHEPWATVAESAELAMTLVRLGRRREAAELLAWQDRSRDADGAWWMGWQFALDIPWPLEKPSWTQAAMILAHEALAAADPGAHVLTAG